MISNEYSYYIKPLDDKSRIYLKDFDCGNPRINHYLKTEASYYELAKTYLFIVKENRTNEETLIGFFSLCADTLLEEQISKLFQEDETSINKRKIYQLGPAIRINMFAIDQRFQHRKEVFIGETTMTYAHCMLILCISIIEEIVKNHVGATYIVLHSTKEGEPLYRFVGGFQELEEALLLVESIDNIKLKPMYRVIFEEDY